MILNSIESCDQDSYHALTIDGFEGLTTLRISRRLAKAALRLEVRVVFAALRADDIDIARSCKRLQVSWEYPSWPEAFKPSSIWSRPFRSS